MGPARGWGTGGTGELGAFPLWYTLNTKPHRERQVAEALGQRQLELYLPLVRVNPANPRASRERPFFPGYLFVRLDLQAVDFNRLRWTPGLRSFVNFGGEPAPLPDHLIAELKRRISKIWAAGGQVFYGLEPGDTLRIVDGPFEGYEAIFDTRLKGTERVRVLLKLIEEQPHRRPGQFRYLPLELNAGSIAKAKPRRA